MNEQEVFKNGGEALLTSVSVGARGVLSTTSLESGEEVAPIRTKLISRVDEDKASLDDPLNGDRDKSESIVLSEEDSDDAFFAKSFALNSERQKSDRIAEAFTAGLRSLFEEDDDENEEDAYVESVESDSARFQREIETERREALDGVLRQEDADFVFDAGRKFDS